MKKEMEHLRDELIKFNPVRRHNQDDIIDSLAWQNLVFWSRKPQQESKVKEMKHGTLGWWMKQNSMLGNDKTDIFWDMRRSKRGPVYVR